MKRLALSVALLAAGCSGSMSAGPAGCTGNDATVSLAVTPAVVTRGEPTTIAVAWAVKVSVGDASAGLTLGSNPQIEVRVPLQAGAGAGADASGAAPGEYTGELVNPFGPGAPAGVVEVIARGATPPGCYTSATASTTFVLE